MILGVWTNELHHLFHTLRTLVEYGSTTLVSGSFGPLFWVHTVYVGGPTDLGRALPDLVAEINTEYPAGTVSLDCPETVWVDSGSAILVAIEELLRNAVEHNGAAEPSVSISVTVEDETVDIRVVDDGPGTPDGEIEPILDGRETPLSHSSGVGLWITTGIVRDEGGDLWFVGSKDGTTVRIELPVETAPPSV